MKKSDLPSFVLRVFRGPVAHISQVALVAAGFSFGFVGRDANAATAAPLAPAPEESASSVKIEMPPARASELTDQTFTFAFAAFAPESVMIHNGTYRFDYGNRPSTYQAQVGWGLKLFDGIGAFYFEGTLGFSTITGNAVQGVGSDLTSSSYTVGILGMDARLMYAGDWFPWKPLIPFVDAGYRYSIYYQPGASGLESSQGGVGNPVAGAGLRFWLNRQSSLAGSMPFFLTAKADRIFPRQNSINLASTSFYGGLTLGL